jgi:hypothetical protein
MNNKRREKLAKAFDLLQDGRNLIEEVLEEEQEVFDNLPENLQNSEKGETLESNVELLQDLFDELDNMNLDDVLEL